jgi:hypothetical protein
MYRQVSVSRCKNTPYQLLEAVRLRSDLQLISSAALLEALADVLTRPSPAKRLAGIGKYAHAVLADCLEVVELVSAREVPRVVPNDSGRLIDLGRSLQTHQRHASSVLGFSRGGLFSLYRRFAWATTPRSHAWVALSVP